jgi:hypothetical protein
MGRSQVQPPRIPTLDPLDLPHPPPPLQLLLSPDRLSNVTGLLHEDESDGLVPIRMVVGVDAGAVLRHASGKVVGHADVELAGLAGEDVNGVLAGHAGRSRRAVNVASNDAMA